MGQLMAVPLTKLLNYVETLYEVYTRRKICSEVIKVLTRDFRQQTDDYGGLNTLMQTRNETFNSFINFNSIQHARWCTRNPFQNWISYVFVQLFVPGLFIPGSYMGFFHVRKGMIIHCENFPNRCSFETLIDFVHLPTIGK